MKKYELKKNSVTFAEWDGKICCHEESNLSWAAIVNNHHDKVYISEELIDDLSKALERHRRFRVLNGVIAFSQEIKKGDNGDKVD